MILFKICLMFFTKKTIRAVKTFFQLIKNHKIFFLIFSLTILYIIICLTVSRICLTLMSLVKLFISKGVETYFQLSKTRNITFSHYFFLTIQYCSPICFDWQFSEFVRNFWFKYTFFYAEGCRNVSLTPICGIVFRLCSQLYPFIF